MPEWGAISLVYAGVWAWEVKDTMRAEGGFFILQQSGWRVWKRSSRWPGDEPSSNCGSALEAQESTCVAANSVPSEPADHSRPYRRPGFLGGGGRGGGAAPQRIARALSREK